MRVKAKPIRNMQLARQELAMRIADGRVEHAQRLARTRLMDVALEGVEAVRAVASAETARLEHVRAH